MVTGYKKVTAFIISFIIFASSVCAVLPQSARAYSAPVSNFKIGLYYGSSALEGANLENADGSGRGYDFGYLDSKRNFVSIGATTDETQISMIMDKNMYYDASTRNYAALGQQTKDTVIGCYHIQLEKTYSNFAEARAAADTFTSVNAFPKYYRGKYYVCVGAYTSQQAASAAAPTLSLNKGYTINSGTAYTVTVVKTGTTKILLEFDDTTNNYLTVKPKNSKNPITWFKGTKYYGFFQYRRESSGKLTVINVIDPDNYVKGVVPYEMSSSWPLEALKTQAVSARTYAMANLNSKHSSYGFDLCTTADCQVYKGITDRCNANSDAAATQTSGMYLVYNGTLCNTYYSAANGGATESSENVWTTAYPYLRGKLDPYEKILNLAGYEYSATYTGADFTAHLKNKGHLNDGENVIDVIPKYTEVGNIYSVTFKIERADKTIKTLVFSKRNAYMIIPVAKSQRFTITCNGTTSTGSSGIYIDGSTSSVESIGGMNVVGGDGKTDYKLPTSGDIYAATGSGTEKINIPKDGTATTGKNGPDTVYTVKGTGNGHNVGMSQWGAYSMAKHYNKTYIQILEFYYDGAKVEKAS